MTLLLKRVSLALLLTAFSISGFSQSPSIRIRFIGNAGLHLSDGTSNLYVDFPYVSGAHHYMTYPDPELDSLKAPAQYLFTHKHTDHYSSGLLKKTNGKAYGPWNTDELKELESSMPAFSIQAFKTQHRFTFGQHNSYLITWHGKKIFISGDTEDADTILSVHGIDWAFIPAWLLLDVRAKKQSIDARMIAIYHIGPKDNVTTTTPEKIWLLKETGQMINIEY
jgi:L-ascorbate metabolism protein UlaG (beta-lactamase superfamily)